VGQGHGDPVHPARPDPFRRSHVHRPWPPLDFFFFRRRKSTTAFAAMLNLMKSVAKVLARKAVRRVDAGVTERWRRTAAAPHHSVRQGVSNLVDDYVDVLPSDEVFILYTLDARDPAAWICSEFITHGFEPRVIRMNAVHDETLEQRLREVLPDPATLRSRIVVLTVERDTMSHFLQLRRALAPCPEQAWAM